MPSTISQEARRILEAVGNRRWTGLTLLRLAEAWQGRDDSLDRPLGLYHAAQLAAAVRNSRLLATIDVARGEFDKQAGRTQAAERRYRTVSRGAPRARPCLLASPRRRWFAPDH